MKRNETSRMSPVERRSVAVLATIYGLRIFGLFLILPVFAVFATTLEGHTPLLIGLALGAYGLTQALFQIPFGAWSDRFGRKPVIIAGLLIFVVGSVIAALSNSIGGVILGRAIQGAGAVPAAVMALLADLTREEQRLKAMAVIGATIGGSFILSMVVSPLLEGAIGVRGIFWLTAFSALAAIAILALLVPTPQARRETASISERLPQILRHRELARLNAGIFFLHLVLTALFVALPQAIVAHLGLDVHEHWKLYLPNMLVALITMVPFVIIANKKRRAREVMLGAIAALAVAQVILLFGYASLTTLVVGLWLFFTAFNLLEAMLPSLVSRLAPPEAKGAAIGIYSTAQFGGAFAGGVLGGWLYGASGTEAVFLLGVVLLVVWFLVALPMAEPEISSTRQLRLAPRYLAQAEIAARELSRLPGVREAVIVAEEGIAYLKVDPHLFDADRLKEFAA